MPPTTINWWDRGERLFLETLSRLSDEDFDKPSLLPGWRRTTVVAHVARNADALVNLLTWARTGTESPMYASPEARDVAIAETAALSKVELRTDYQGAAKRLAAAVNEFPDTAWGNVVRTAQGRSVPASEVIWMRCREVWIHAVDLDIGISFADMPNHMLVALVDDVTDTWRRRKETPPVRFVAASEVWGEGVTTVTGNLPDLAAWVAGRRSDADLTIDGPTVELPRWL